MPLVSAKEFRERKKGGASSDSSSGSGGGLVSAKDFKSRKNRKEPTLPSRIAAGQLPSFDVRDSSLVNAAATSSRNRSSASSSYKPLPTIEERPDLPTDYPGGWLNPVNLLNAARKSVPGHFIDRFAQGAGKAIGLRDDQMSSPASTGNNIADNIAEFVGGAAGYMVNPGMPVGNLGVGQFFEHPALQMKALQIGNKYQDLLPSMGMKASKDGTTLVDSMLGKTVNRMFQGAVQGGVGAAAYSPFHTLATSGDERDIPANMLLEGALGLGFGSAIGAATPGVQRAFQSLLKRRGSAAPEVDYDTIGQAAQARTVEQARSGSMPVNPAQQAADRFGFVDRHLRPDVLALPPARRDARINAAQQRSVNPAGTDPIAGRGDIRTFALPEPDVAPPTAARRTPARNTYREKFDKLIRVANAMEHPPGRELESLEELWSRMATRDDPSLDDLIRLAYPPEKPIPSDLVSRARARQSAREVAGAPGPVRSMNDRYNGGVMGEAVAPVERLRDMRQPKPPAPEVEVIQPQRRFAPSDNPSLASSSAPVTSASTAPVRSTRGGKGRSKGSARQTFVTASEFRARRKQEATNTPAPAEGNQNYAGNPIPFRQAATQTERTINRNQVVRNLRKNLGVVIDSGKLQSSRGVLGIYKIKPEVVRTRMAEDLQVISHEIGHHLDKKHTLQDSRFMNEYVAILKNNPVLNVAAYQPSQLPGEGVAEFIRLMLTDPAKARQLAPRFTAYFESKVPPKLLQGLEASARDIDTWITQGEYNQAKGLIDFDSGSRKEPFSWNKFYARFVDDLNPLKLVEQALKGKVGIGKDSVYKMARLSRGVAEKAKLAVTRGIYDSSGNKVVNGLAEIVKPLEKLGVTEKDFATYLAVKHAVDLKKLNKQVPFSDGQIKAVLQTLDTPEIRAVQQEVIKYNNALLDILVDAQILTRKAVNEMKDKYKNYVPFFRYFDDDAVAGFKNGGFGAAKGFANLTNPIKTMSEEGSTRTLINPIESIIKNTMLVMNAAAKNKVGLQLADLAKVEGAGAWVEHLGKGGRDPKGHIVSVFENGKQQQYKIREPELYNAMLSLDAESSNSLLRFLGGAASMLRAGATLTPEFTIRNAARDIVSATINSTKYGFNPLDFFKGMGHVIGKTKTFDQFISSGGAMGTMMSLDRDVSREALKAVFRTSLRDKTMNIVTSPKELAKLVTGYTPLKTVVGGLRKAAEVSELSTKVGAFNKTLKKTGSLEEAAFTARDLMDFNRAGSAIRQANKAVAFLNASIQGTDRMVRGFKENKASFLVRAFTSLVLPSIGLYIWHQNLNPEHKKALDNIPQWQKDTFFIIPGPDNEFFRIPKPFEAGMLFSTGTERTLDWFAENDPEAFDGYATSVAGSMTPPVLFTALTPLLEAITNHSFFRKAPVVPQGEQRFEKKDQYSLYTSETAKLLGELVAQIPGLDDSNAASPRIIDNTIKGYTAGLGQYGVTGVDAILNAVTGGSEISKPAKKWSEQPFVKAFTVSTAGGGQVRQDFYDKWDKLSKAKASADRRKEPFKDPAYGRMNAAYNIISKLNTQYKRVQQDRAISAQLKRSKLDALDGKMNDIAAKGLGK